MVTHDILVRGVGLALERQTKPVLLGMRDADFPNRLFGDIGLTTGRLSSAATVTKGVRNVLHLLQPVQRKVQVAMVDLACDAVMQPRLDPRRIVSAVLVIRRVARNPDGSDDPARLEGWMKSPEGKFQWHALGPSEQEWDPDPARRPPPASGQASLDRLLAADRLRTAWTEVTSPAFSAPPALGERTARTIVYAPIPTASADVSDGAPTIPDYGDGRELRAQMPPLLLAGYKTVPLAGQWVEARHMSADYLQDNDLLEFRPFITLLQVLTNELDAFGDGGEALRDALARRRVFYDVPEQEESVLSFLDRAQKVLVQYDGSGPAPSIRMPDRWEASDQADEDAFLRAARDRLRARAALVVSPEGRYQDHTREYVLRLFLRVRGHDGCPPRTICSAYSERFEIAPWYESAGLVGPPVPLPKPGRGFFKAAKPNVAFVVPAPLMNAIQSLSLKGMSTGTRLPDPGMTLTWICGFNIPIITICAFILLNIILGVLNIIFFWMPFVKICIPFPSAAARQMGDE